MKSKWTLEILKQEALKYESRGEFQSKNRGCYRAACRRGILDQICIHMKPSKLEPYSFEELSQEALKYKNRGDFFKNSNGAYQVAYKRKILDQICTHMNPSQTEPYSFEELRLEALKYKTRSEFYTKSPNIYSVILKRELLEELCFHMKRSSGVSIVERELMGLVKKEFSSAKRIRDSKVKIKNKSHIKGFEIDIFVPELNKGIEFDGTYHHSFDGLKRSRLNWPDEDIHNYHKLKDDWFSAKGIQILHVKEQDWLNNKEECIEKCFQFLNDMKE